MTGYYGLGPWHPDGCSPCYCSGHSTTCDSAADWRDTFVYSHWNLLDGFGETDTPWTAVDQQGQSVTVNYHTHIVDDSGAGDSGAS